MAVFVFALKPEVTHIRALLTIKIDINQWEPFVHILQFKYLKDEMFWF